MKMQSPIELALRRRRQKFPRRSKRLPKFPAPRIPKLIERGYLKDLLPYLEAIKRAATLRVIPSMAGLTRQIEAMKPEAARNDSDATNQFKRVINEAKDSVSQAYTDEEIAAIAAKKGIETSAFNKQVLKRGLEKVTGVEVLYGEPWLDDTMHLFVAQNVDLITSISDDAFYDIQNMVMTGWQQGTRWEDIADQIESYVDLDDGRTRSRAELIARDQIGKLNGQLNYMRQSEIGVDRYTWRTVGDDRVRDNHASKNGEVFDWSDPPEDTGHPGEDFQCRCWAEPVLEDLVPGLESADDSGLEE